MKKAKLTNNKIIKIKGANLHNLKNISVNIPKEKLIVVSGVSGSGKSTLIFDTLFAEGQRRYIESLSSYARQFLGKLQKPDVEEISGISPAIAIQQKKITSNSRSTVATSTEIYDYLKLLFSRIGKTFSPISNKEVKKHQVKDVLKFIRNTSEKTPILILAKCKIKDEILNILLQEGFSRVFYKNEVKKITDLIEKKIIIKEKLFIVIDRIKNNIDFTDNRIVNSIETAFFEGNGECVIKTNNKKEKFSNKFEEDGINFKKNDVNLFSFNNPYGACRKCEGFGFVLGIDKEKVITNKNLSLYEGAVNCWNGNTLKNWKNKFIKHSSEINFPVHRAYKDLTKEQKEILWNGKEKCKGIYQFFEKLEKKKYKIQNRVLISRYRGKTECDKCSGSRLRKEALYVKINNKNIAQITKMTVLECINFFNNIKLKKAEKEISSRIIKEINSRLYYLNKVGLGYLSLNRNSNTLSGGETQRINIATSIGSSLVGAMYILDEPSIGLHSQDTQNLIEVLIKLRDIGNTVIVVEHDDEIIKHADYIIDIGPKAGIHGGEIVYEGALNKLHTNPNSLTGKYLKGILNIPIPNIRRKSKEKINIKEINKHNLNNVEVTFPLNMITLVTGMSGSGKSTLVKDVLRPMLTNYLDNIVKEEEKIKVSSNKLKRLEFIDQNPIGKSSRSNPITYIKAYDDIRKLFSQQPLSKARNYTSGFFSFNVEGGRCNKCKGEGEIVIEMQFMADVYLKCEECQGKRFKEEILEVKFYNKSIDDILNLSVEEAIFFFSNNNENRIATKIKPLKEVGLDYVKLGQSSNTLSGGEAQRIKLAYFLSKGETEEKTLFIFDEPTTGLHFDDINKLIISFNRLIEKGHSIICVEHNLDVIKCADWIIDLGPEGGDKGGEIVFTGTPEEIIHNNSSFTGKYLKNKINSENPNNSVG